MKYLLLIICVLTAGLMALSLAQADPTPADPPSAEATGEAAAELGAALADEPPASQPDADRAHAHPRRRPVGRLPGALTDAQRDQVLEFLKNEQPDLYRVLEELRQKDPRRYQAMLQQAGRSALYLIDLKRSNPELYGLYLEDLQLGKRIGKLAGEVRQADDPAAKSALVDELRVKLEERFQLTQERQRLQISQFRRRVERLESVLQARQANKDKIIEKQLEMLVSVPPTQPAGAGAAQPTPGEPVAEADVDDSGNDNGADDGRTVARIRIELAAPLASPTDGAPAAAVFASPTSQPAE